MIAFHALIAKFIINIYLLIRYAYNANNHI